MYSGRQGIRGKAIPNNSKAFVNLLIKQINLFTTHVRGFKLNSRLPIISFYDTGTFKIFLAVIA